MEQTPGVPECLVCFQAYDARQNIPRVLSCGHSLCECCASSLAAQDAELRFQRSFLRCPECNQRSKLPVTGVRGLPKNIELLRCIQTSVTGSTAKAEGSSTSNQALDRRTRFQKFYLVSAFLYEGFASELRRWIIPQTCVRLPGGSHRLQLNVLSGEIFIFLDDDLRYIYQATFLPVEIVWSSTNFQNLKVSKDAEYCERIRSLLELLTRPQRTDLFHLLRISALHERVGPIFGFWMNAEGHLYLVCKALATGLRYFSQISILQKTLVPRKSITGEEVCQHCNTLLSNDFLNRGKEMCELFMGLHGQGLAAGLVTPCCLGFTEFHHLSLDVNALLSVRNSMKAYVKSQYTVTSVEDRFLDMTHPEETVKIGEPEKPWLSRDNQPTIDGSYFYYASPELLSSLAGLDFLPGSNITSKTDAWTLGCLLSNLLSGETPWDNLLLHDFLQKPLNGVKIAESWIAERLVLNLAGWNSYAVGTNDWPMDFVKLLARCFADIPEDRPAINEIWHFFHCVDASLDSECDLDLNGQNRKFPAIQGQKANSLWCLALECNINAVRECPTEEQTISKTPCAGAPQMQDILSGSVEDHVEEAEPVGFLDGHSADVTSLVVCGQYLVSASFDKSICVWSLKDAALIKTLKGHAHRVMALAADGQSLLCISGDYGGEICAWDLEAAIPDYLKKWHDHQDWRYSGVASLAVSADYFLYSGSGDKTIKVWSLQDYSLVATMEGHTSLVSALLIDKEVLYSGSWDGTIRLWWRNDHSPLTVLGESLEVDAVRSLAMSTDLLLAGHHSGKIQVWRDEACLKSLVAHDGVVSNLCSDEDALFSGSWDGNIKAWNIRELLDDATPKVVEMCGSAITSLACHNRKLYAGLATKFIFVKSLQTICGALQY